MGQQIRLHRGTLEATRTGGRVLMIGDTGRHSVQVRAYGDVERASQHAEGFAEANGATPDQALTFQVAVEGEACQELEARLQAHRKLRVELERLQGELGERMPRPSALFLRDLQEDVLHAGLTLSIDAAVERTIERTAFAASCFERGRRLLGVAIGMLERIEADCEPPAPLELEELPVVQKASPRRPGYAIPPRPDGLEDPEAVGTCDHCGGAGLLWQGGPRNLEDVAQGPSTCPACNGDGVVELTVWTPEDQEAWRAGLLMGPHEKD